MVPETSIGIELQSNNEEFKETDTLMGDPLKKFRLSEKITNERDEYTEELFRMLIDEKEDDFIGFIKNLARQQIRPNLNCNNGNRTYLQYACLNGLNKVAEYLIQSGADLCAIGQFNTYPPIFEAVTYQNAVAIHCIIEKDKNQLFMYYMGDNILHWAARLKKEQISDTLEVLNCILTNIKYCYLPGGIQEARYLLNEENPLEETPLDIAIGNGIEGIIFTLLENGVDMFWKNGRGESMFLNMFPTTLEKYFDRKVSTEYNEEVNQIAFNYTSIVPPECLDDNTVSEETSRIMYLSKLPDFRHLIKHPVVSTLIHLKWQKVKWLFYFNLMVYVIFCCFFTGHILVNKGGQNGCSKILITICVFILTVRELLQVSLSPLAYLFQLENWIEVSLMVTTLLTMFCNTSVQRQISSVAIFLTWTELLLLLGRYPILSIQVEMYKRVSLHFLKYLSVYSIFAIAFALNFYILFYDSSNENSSVISILSNVTTTMYDTSLRLGDLGSVPIEEHPVIGRVFFFMFLLLIFIIMLNLLNGLAVSDTQAIIDESELFVPISRLKFISSVEKMCQKFGAKVLMRFNVLKNCSSPIDGYKLVSGKDMDPEVLKTARQMSRNCHRDTMEDKLSDFFCRVSETNKSVDKKIIRIDNNVQFVRDTLKKEDKFYQLLGRIDDMKKTADQNMQGINNEINVLCDTLKVVLDRVASIEQKLTSSDIPANKFE